MSSNDDQEVTVSTVIDTPAGINAWRVLSAVSQLSLEISTGVNYYGKVSVYKGIRAHLVDGLPERATMRNKCLALLTILSNLPEDALQGPVCTRARAVLDAKLQEMGWVVDFGG